MTYLLYLLMYLADVALVCIVAAKYARGTLTARWFFSVPVLTLAVGAATYLL